MSNTLKTLLILVLVALGAWAVFSQSNSGWQTYNAEGRGFEVKLPSEYVATGFQGTGLAPGIDVVTITNPRDTEGALQPRFVVNYFSDDAIEKTTLEREMQNSNATNLLLSDENTFKEFEPSKTTKITFLGEPAYELEYVGSTTAKRVVVKHGAIVYLITRIPADDPIFERIVGTLRFTK